MKKKEYNYIEQASKTLWQLGSFKWTVLVIPIISFVVTMFIIGSNHLSFDTTYEGWNNLIIIFRVPLGILALIIPIVAAIASNHRSLQSKVQIELQDGQNKFANYYKHKEEFHKYLETSLTNVRTDYKIHSIIFPTSQRGDYKIDIKIIKYVEDKIDHIYNLLSGYSEETSDKNIQLLYSIEILIQKLENDLGIKSELNGRQYIGNGIKIIIQGGGSLRGHLISVKRRLENIKTIFEFDKLSSLPCNFNKILDLDFTSVPDVIDAMTLKDNNGFNMSKILKNNNVLVAEENK